VIAGLGQRAISVREQASRYLTLGVRIAPGARAATQPAAIRPVAASLETERVADGVRFRIRVPSARVVELAGDFNAWTAVRLRLTNSGVWETIIPLAAGSQRMSIRVDGGTWRAPPGTAEVDDDFDGSVGIVVVP
jgi:1,4-alpha-glucan branching enzyme